MREMTKEAFEIINQTPKINRTHWNLPLLRSILKFSSLKISLETLELFFSREEKIEISREASWDIWNSLLITDQKSQDFNGKLINGYVDHSHSHIRSWKHSSESEHLWDHSSQ